MIDIDTSQMQCAVLETLVYQDSIVPVVIKKPMPIPPVYPVVTAGIWHRYR